MGPEIVAGLIVGGVYTTVIYFFGVAIGRRVERDKQKEERERKGRAKHG